MSLVEYGRFDMIYIGIYSVRPGTYAARKYEDNVPKDVKHDRWNRLNELLKVISAENNAKEIGNERVVMLTKKQKLSSSKVEYGGYTDNQKQIKIIYDGDELQAPSLGDFVQVKIIDSRQFVLFGELL